MARRAEELGYASAWMFQRLLYAVAPRNEYYGAPGPWPEAFRARSIPIVALTWAAAHTRTIRLGVSVLIMPFYQPLVLAKQLATLDVVSRRAPRRRRSASAGRSTSSRRSASPPTSAAAAADEFLRCLDGDLDARTSWSSPASSTAFRARAWSPSRCSGRVRPSPVGGYSEAVLQRAATLGDGYTGGNIPLADLVARGRARAGAAAAPRAVTRRRFPIVCRGSFRRPRARPGPGAARCGARADEIREDIRRYAAAGVTELFLDPNFQPGGADLVGARTDGDAGAEGLDADGYDSDAMAHSSRAMPRQVPPRAPPRAGGAAARCRAPACPTRTSEPRTLFNQEHDLRCSQPLAPSRRSTGTVAPAVSP